MDELDELDKRLRLRMRRQRWNWLNSLSQTNLDSKLITKRSPSPACRIED